MFYKGKLYGLTEDKNDINILEANITGMADGAQIEDWTKKKLEKANKT